MGRPSQSRALGLWANGVRVGRWLLPKNGPMELTYDPGWLASEAGRPLSLSLPLNFDGLPIKGEKVGNFFENLLPDSTAIRQRIQERFALTGGRAFDLLAAIGRDCAGALQLLAEDEEPKGVKIISVTPISEADVEKVLLRSMSASRLVDEEEEDFRISIAGAQEKTALTWHQGRWCVPHGSTPTTHIFKLSLDLVGGRRMDMSHSLENEWLCARILHAYGLRVASCEVLTFGATKALVVERFDRALHSSKRYWLRLPQEDFCQATGTPPAGKYEADGGPGLREIAKILAGSEAREEDIASLLRAQLLFWMLAATDGHAKNFSLHLFAEGRFRLTPLYDVLSAWPITGSRHDQIHESKLKLAMALHATNRHYRVAGIRRHHFETTARACGLSGMDAIIDDVVSRTPEVIAQVESELPRGFPPALFESITGGLRRSAARLA